MGFGSLVSNLKDKVDDRFSGKSGIITTANGLRIACLGGRYDPDVFESALTAPVRYTILLNVHVLCQYTLPRVSVPPSSPIKPLTAFYQTLLIKPPIRLNKAIPLLLQYKLLLLPHNLLISS